MSIDLAEALLIRSILESPKGVIIFSLDTEYRYTVFTRSHAQVMQAIWGKEIKVGMSMLDCISSDEDRLKAKRSFDRALAGEHLVEVEEYGDAELSRTYWENRFSPLHDQEGRIVGLAVFVADKTEQRRIEEHEREVIVLREVLREREMLLNGLGEGVFGLDSDDICFFVNPAALDILGFAEDDFIGKKPLTLVRQLQRASQAEMSHDAPCLIATRSLTRYDEVDWLTTKHGHSLPVRLIANPIVREEHYAGSIIAFNDITSQYLAEKALKDKNAQLSCEITTDPLTDCKNRRFIDQHGQNMWDISFETNAEFSIIALDIDFFKNINDEHGHGAGDMILRSIADVIHHHVRSSDVVVRTGGEEFSVLLPSATLESACRIAERIREAIACSVFRYGDEALFSTVSLGVVSRSERDSCLADTMRRADMRLYQAKANGRNIVAS